MKASISCVLNEMNEVDGGELGLACNGDDDATEVATSNDHCSFTNTQRTMKSLKLEIIDDCLAGVI